MCELVASDGPLLNIVDTTSEIMLTFTAHNVNRNKNRLGMRSTDIVKIRGIKSDDIIYGRHVNNRGVLSGSIDNQ